MAVLVVAGGLWIILGPQPSDQEQITEAMNNAVKASREGRPGGVVEYLADSFEVNNTKYDVSRQVADAIQKYHPDIELSTTQAKVNGDSATVSTDVKLRILSKSISIPDVTFKLHKDVETKWLVLPTKSWKLEGASVPPEAVPAVLSQMPDLGINQGVPVW